MPEINVRFTWEKAKQLEYMIPRGYILLKYHEDDRNKVTKYLTALDKKQAEKDDLIENIGKLHFNTRMATLSQKALLFSLYGIEANEMHGALLPFKDNTIQSNELYIQDLLDCCPREQVKTKRNFFQVYAEQYSVITQINHGEQRYSSVAGFLEAEIPGEDTIIMTVIRGASMMTTKELAGIINNVFNRIAYAGISVYEPDDIKTYWLNWKKYLNDQKIVLHDDLILSQKDYKALHPICESCGKLIAHSGGELAHIKAVGMGSNRDMEPARNYSSNWLHLCCDCHREIWHKKGVKYFMVKVPHLRYKVSAALKKDYPSVV